LILPICVDKKMQISEINCVHLRETVLEYIQNEKRGDFICLW